MSANGPMLHSRSCDARRCVSFRNARTNFLRAWHGGRGGSWRAIARSVGQSEVPACSDRCRRITALLLRHASQKRAGGATGSTEEYPYISIGYSVVTLEDGRPWKPAGGLQIFQRSGREPRHRSVGASGKNPDSHAAHLAGKVLSGGKNL